jgi:hypothetical protein
VYDLIRRAAIRLVAPLFLNERPVNEQVNLLKKNVPVTAVAGLELLERVAGVTNHRQSMLVQLLR